MMVIIPVVKWERLKLTLPIKLSFLITGENKNEFDRMGIPIDSNN